VCYQQAPPRRSSGGVLVTLTGVAVVLLLTAPHAKAYRGQVQAVRGQLQAQFAQEPASAGSAKRAVKFALAQRGKPYRWGAEGPDAYDCSGLTMAAWRAAGVQLPRTAAAQLAHGRRVHGKRKPGDLIVYPSNGPTRRHVAMVTGPGRMVEARGRGIPVRVTAIRPGALGTVRPGGR
jgi:cell wall-associated NlpC family hydrolase